MNFGPLSRDGGYRRLNVAITRAKYNIKLVGSIVPTDIDTDKTSSEGVKCYALILNLQSMAFLRLRMNCLMIIV